MAVPPSLLFVRMWGGLVQAFGLSQVRLLRSLVVCRTVRWSLRLRRGMINWSWELFCQICSDTPCDQTVTRLYWPLEVQSGWVTELGIRGVVSESSQSNHGSVCCSLCRCARSEKLGILDSICRAAYHMPTRLVAHNPQVALESGRGRKGALFGPIPMQI